MANASRRVAAVRRDRCASIASIRWRSTATSSTSPTRRAPGATCRWGRPRRCASPGAADVAATRRVARQRLLTVWIATMLALAGCASEPLVMRYDTRDADGRVWPPQQTQEVPRYRYVGQLTGEGNFVRAQGESSGL